MFLDNFLTRSHLRYRHRYLLTILLLSFHPSLVALAESPAAERARDPESRRIWVSRAANLEDLGREVTNLYKALDQANKLSFIKVPNRLGEPAERLLRSNQYYFGKAFKREMEALTCYRNREICRTMDESGPAPTFRWTNQADHPITLPAISFTPRFGRLLFNKTKNQADLITFVIDHLGGCEKADQICIERIRSLNHGSDDFLTDDFEGPVWLPVLKLETRLDLRDAPKLENKLAPNLVPAARGGAPVKLPDTAKDRNEILHLDRFQEYSRDPMPEPARYSTDAIAMLNASVDADSEMSPPWNATDMILQRNGDDYRALHPASSSVERAHLDSPRPLTRERFSEQQRELYRLIDVPRFAELAWLGRLTRSVVVVDSGYIDPNHCAFSGRVEAHNLDPQLDETNECGTPARLQNPSSPELILDHGTHVTGLIAAGIHPADSPHQLHGLDPEAKVMGYQMRIDRKDFYLPHGSEIIQLATSNKPSVVNMSFYYEFTSNGGIDDIKNTIVDLEGLTLFVAAAGNSAEEHGAGCKYFPACYGLANIITVAALDLSPSNPRLLPGSDFGPRVDLGVPAVAVPSTALANRIGELEGTSQAAPLVAATAALISTHRSGPRPVQIRHRLIYTSDLFPELRGKLLGGRLNVRRALDLDRQTIKLAAGAQVIEPGVTRVLTEPTAFRGRITGVGSSPTQPESELFVHLGSRTSGRPVLLQRYLKRLTADPRHVGRFHAFIVEDSADGDPNQQKLKPEDVTLGSPSRWIFMDVESADQTMTYEIRFELRNLLDFVAALR